MINLTEDEITKNWKDENILVSINTLTYNHEKYIAQCIEGILMQKTNFAFELLIHDDASTDNTAAIIKEYEKKYPKIIKPIYQTENQWSKGIKIAATYQYPRVKGKYIALCEGDDYWIDENKLQMQVDFLENNPEYTMCFHNANILNKFDIKCGLRCDLIKEKDYTSLEFIKNWIVPTASILIKKNILLIKLKHSKKILNGDIAVVLKSAHYGKVRAFEKKMSVYRVHPQGVTYDEKLQLKRTLAYPDHFITLKRNFPSIRGEYINVVIWNLCINLYKNTDRNIKWIWKAFLASPGYFFHRVFNKIFKFFKK